jgi:hypothetical protein
MARLTRTAQWLAINFENRDPTIGLSRAVSGPRPVVRRFDFCRPSLIRTATCVSCLSNHQVLLIGTGAHEAAATRTHGLDKQVTMRHSVVQKRDWLICRHALQVRGYQARVARGREPVSPILHTDRNYLATRGQRQRVGLSAQNVLYCTDIRCRDSLS